MMRISLAICLIAIPVSAQMSERGRTAFEAGRTAYDAGDYTVAMTHWQQSLRESGHPKLHYNIGLAHEALSHDAEAVAAYERFLRWEADTPRGDEVRGRIVRLRKPADEGPFTKFEEPPEPEPPQEPPQAPQAVAPVPAPVRSDVLPVSLLVGGGALILAGSITGVLAVGADSDLDTLCGADRQCAAGDLREGRDLGSTVDTLGIATDVLLPLGAIVTGVGAWLMWAGNEDISIACNTQGCEGSVRWDI